MKPSRCFTLNLVALAALALPLATAAPQSTPPKKRALLVGIDRYERIRPLAGAKNDVAWVKETLIAHYGYTEEDIVVLTDKDATASNIIERIKKHLIKDLGPEDSVIFYFSGHGGQVPDVDGDEADGRDEILVTHDFSSKNPATWMTDDVVFQLTQHLPTEKALLVFDSCNSATVWRDPTTEAPQLGRPAWLPADSDIRLARLGFFESTEPATGVEQPGTALIQQVGTDLGDMITDQDNPNHVYISACAASQFAFETRHPERDARHGLLTTEICQRLAAAPPNYTFGQLRDDVTKDVVAWSDELKQRQYPTFETEAFPRQVESYLGEKPLPGDVATKTASTTPIKKPSRNPLRALEDIIGGWQPRGDAHIELEMDNDVYTVGDLIKVTVTPGVDGYLCLYFFSPPKKAGETGTSMMIFPNRFQKDNRVKAGQTITLPPAGKDFEFRAIEPAGTEVLYAVVSSVPLTDAEQAVNLQRPYQVFQDQSPATIAARTGRAIGVFAPGEYQPSPDKADPVVGESLFIYEVKSAAKSLP